jgi:phosphoglycerate dehydrogenase-like enzyme
MNLLHIAARKPVPSLWNDLFLAGLSALGELAVVEDGVDIPEPDREALIRRADVLLTGWGAAPVPPGIARDPGRLRYICHITGEMRGTIPLEIIDAGIPVTNWGTAPANGVAEGAMALLLTVLKDLRTQVRRVRDGEWGMDMSCHGGSLWNLNVGIYGCGAIGRRFVELLRPFGPNIRVFDPFAANLPEGCARADTLEDLFRGSQAIIIHAGLSPATRGTVTADLLALLPRHGIVINTARGGIIEQAALFAELETGRLRAGLDVLEPDTLPPDHPARRWENLVLSCHRIEHPWPMFGEPASRLTPMHEIALDNLGRFARSQPLRFPMTHERYLLST